MNFSKEKGMWLNWMQIIPAFVIDKSTPYTDLLIPTIDSVRNNFFVNLYISLKEHCLLTGPTGTGKTLNIINEINAKYMNDEFTNM